MKKRVTPKITMAIQEKKPNTKGCRIPEGHKITADPEMTNKIYKIIKHSFQ